MPTNEALFDLFSYGRRGPGRRDQVSPGDLAHISRTVRRTPEVMVKILSRGGEDLKAVGRHVDYLRLREDGERELETDDGRQLTGEDATSELLEDWDLGLDEHRRRSNLDAVGGGSKKLVHKILFSMPAGTAPDKVLTAVKNFAREEFGLKHRYAMVLHTDEPHPHVHMLVKAVSEQGERLHVRKATLRGWRRGFARHLRELGVEANATERAVRGAAPTKLDGIYRSMTDVKRYSTHMTRRVESVGAELGTGALKPEPGGARVRATRQDVLRGWRSVRAILLRDGQAELAAQVDRFANQMPAAMTERERLAAHLIERKRELPRKGSPSR